MSEDGRSPRGLLAALLLLAALVLWVHRGAGERPYIGLDDPAYVTGNPRVLSGLTAEGFRWSLTAFHASNWHPVTWLSHMADVSVFGPEAGAPHRVNVILHLCASWALLLFLRDATGAPLRSAGAAVLFAVHPLHVEPVAWVSERKELLCALFAFLSLWSWRRYTVRPGAARYAPAAALYALSLASKPMAVSLPFLMLLLDLWPFGRLRLHGEGGGVAPFRLVVEKVPFFLLSAASCLVTWLAQAGGGAFQPIPLGERLRNGAVSAVVYLGKAVWPAGLSVFYPHPYLSGGTSAVAASSALLLLLAATAAALAFGRERRWLPVGWFWYLGTLVPVSGIVQVGGQGMADRYTYLPLTGIFLVAAWAVPSPPPGWSTGKRAVAAVAAALVAAALVARARGQALLWSDEGTLFRNAAEVTRGNWQAHLQLGKMALAAGDDEEALARYREVLRILPGDSHAEFSVYTILDRMGRKEEALRHLSAGVRSLGDAGKARSAGMEFAMDGRYDEAAACFGEALRLAPGDAGAHYDLAVALFRAGRREEAAPHFRESLKAPASTAEEHNRAGVALVRLGRPAEAEPHFREALRLRPADRDARANLDALPRRGAPGAGGSR